MPYTMMIGSMLGVGGFIFAVKGSSASAAR